MCVNIGSVQSMEYTGQEIFLVFYNFCESQQVYIKQKSFWHFFLNKLM